MTIGHRVTFETSTAKASLWQPEGRDDWHVYAGPQNERPSTQRIFDDRDRAEQFACWVYLAPHDVDETPSVTWDGPYDTDRSLEENTALHGLKAPTVPFPWFLVELPEDLVEERKARARNTAPTPPEPFDLQKTLARLQAEADARAAEKASAEAVEPQEAA